MHPWSLYSALYKIERHKQITMEHIVAGRSYLAGKHARTLAQYWKSLRHIYYFDCKQFMHKEWSNYKYWCEWSFSSLTHLYKWMQKHHISYELLWKEY